MPPATLPEKAKSQLGRNSLPAHLRPPVLTSKEIVVSKFDKVSAFLLALAMFFGLLVGMLFLLWLTSGKPKIPKALPPIEEIAAGRGENAEGFERDFEPPGAEEIEELLEPTIEETLVAVTDAVTSVPAEFDAVASDSSASTQGTGRGDSRPPGPMGEGEDIVPRFERWKLKFLAKNVQAYAVQLDFFGIELGAIGGGIKGVDYAANLAGAPRTRRGDSKTETRLYFMWTAPSPLQAYDRQLLQKGGVALTNRQLVKFIPQELENLLAHTELEFAKSKGHSSITEVAQTVFECQPSDSGYQFVVIDQKYRKPRKL